MEKSNLRIFKFISELAHEEILEKFNESNIEEINYILADESIGLLTKIGVVLKSLTLYLECRLMITLFRIFM